MPRNLGIEQPTTIDQSTVDDRRLHMMCALQPLIVSADLVVVAIGEPQTFFESSLVEEIGRLMRAIRRVAEHG